ncbi:hypothetical protein SAMN05216410_0180 [Sanguibacter gelidistatuariae]|uniref:Uncharacterized protein n=1 Tax=Sanguibacter gelidistatuariae TaxID=1814289 RepID=A0A1G6XMH9_9MICO|nr:hypothetical protein [Sanguibacter gelidistatuariae]SDD79370.1 hypothetical protein SAMN05216410_0180 [Sanguibacter gelidistatuariae]
MITTDANVNPAPHASNPSHGQSTRIGTWFRARVEAYVASNEEAFRTAEPNASMDLSVR